MNKMKKYALAGLVSLLFATPLFVIAQEDGSDPTGGGGGPAPVNFKITIPSPLNFCRVV